AVALAEQAWLDDDCDGVVHVVRDVLALANERADPWACGELSWWLWRAGEPPAAPAAAAEPYARAIAGDWRGAAEAFTTLGFPYEAGEVLSDSPDADAQVRALAVFDELGATRTASALRRRLRAAGVRRIPRGPRPASRSGPGGLTPRQSEVLGLLAGGATNAQIARSLVITPKTVDHHVSAVLAKLGVGTRREAGAVAAELGVSPVKPR
ncbi:MAG: hypothetical protein QOG77_4053, partial [Solirubrobacteraceae bacterium]|nr:hypothetical protein [Solirubrobacteraceae bacterium]